VALLSAAIQGERDGKPKPLRADGRPLRDVWLDIGDLDKLVRPTNAIDPPSLLRGDEYFLPPLEYVLGDLLVPKDETGLKHPLYLYLTSTSLRATRTAAFATSYDTIDEPDTASSSASRPAGSRRTRRPRTRRSSATRSRSTADRPSGSREPPGRPAASRPRSPRTRRRSGARAIRTPGHSRPT
jgi:hypothetical protein